MFVNSEEYRNMERKHLSILTSYGREYVAHIIASITLLEEKLYGESELSDDKGKELFRMLIDSANKHRELIVWSIRERQRFRDQWEDNNQDQ